MSQFRPSDDDVQDAWRLDASDRHTTESGTVTVVDLDRHDVGAQELRVEPRPSCWGGHTNLVLPGCSYRQFQRPDRATRPAAESAPTRSSAARIHERAHCHSSCRKVRTRPRPAPTVTARFRTASCPNATKRGRRV